MKIAIALTCFAGFLGSGNAVPDWGFNSGFNYGEASRAAYADIEANNPIGDHVNGCYYHNVEFTCSRGPGRRVANRCQYYSNNSPDCFVDLGETNINCQACCTQAGRSGLQQCRTFNRSRRSGGPAPPPRDRIKLESTGPAANRFPGKMGDYTADIDYQGFPSYKMVNSGGIAQYIFAYPVGTTFYWGVSQRLGGLQRVNRPIFAGITNSVTPQVGSPPPATGWKYHNSPTDTFLDDTLMAVETAISCPMTEQQGLGCSASGTCAVWCCSQGEGTQEIPACSAFLETEDNVDYQYDDQK